jgi:hypothetical protein
LIKAASGSGLQSNQRQTPILLRNVATGCIWITQDDELSAARVCRLGGHTFIARATGLRPLVRHSEVEAQLGRHSGGDRHHDGRLLLRARERDLRDPRRRHDHREDHREDCRDHDRGDHSGTRACRSDRGVGAGERCAARGRTRAGTRIGGPGTAAAIAGRSQAPDTPKCPLGLPPGRSVRWVESYKQERGSGRGRVGGCRKATGPGDAGVAEGEHRARERAWLGRRIV